MKEKFQLKPPRLHIFNEKISLRMHVVSTPISKVVFKYYGKPVIDRVSRNRCGNAVDSDEIFTLKMCNLSGFSENFPFDIQINHHNFKSRIKQTKTWTVHCDVTLIESIWVWFSKDVVSLLIFAINQNDFNYSAIITIFTFPLARASDFRQLTRGVKRN